MSERPLAQTSAPRTYAELRRRVVDTLLMGQRQLDEVKVRTYWETGRLIHQHLLVHENRAQYGADVMARLGADAGISPRVLYHCVEFARAYPILTAGSKLTWAHYRALTQVEDQAQRKAFEVQAVKNNWNSHDLADRIRSVALLEAPSRRVTTPGNGESDSGPERLIPKRGTVGVYRIVPGPEGLAVDLGFTTYLDLTPAQARGLREGNLVRLAGDGKISAAHDARPTDLFTYPAEVIRVVDGDTLWMRVYLRPRHWLKEKLRLRGLDCPELDTSQGRSAKLFVQGLVNQATAVAITTTKPDKWDRYLSDVYLKLSSGEEVLLNNVLLENGHAVRKHSYELGDWEPEVR